jgi:hypothetical protein
VGILFLREDNSVFIYDAAKTASRIIIYIFNSGFVCTYSLACSINTELSSLKNKIPTDWYDDISTLVCCFGHEARSKSVNVDTI